MANTHWEGEVSWANNPDTVATTPASGKKTENPGRPSLEEILNGGYRRPSNAQEFPRMEPAADAPPMQPRKHQGWETIV